ncbi:hypothetical protein ACP275_14G320900 [Erythranthe tilingii]
MASDSSAYNTDTISSPPSSDEGPTVVVVVVFVSLGSIFLLAFCLFALWLVIKRRRKNKLVEETDIKRADEHLKVKEEIVKGPHGLEAVVLSIEEDKHFEEEIVKNEKKQIIDGELIKGKNAEKTDLEAGESSSSITSVHKS